MQMNVDHSSLVLNNFFVFLFYENLSGKLVEHKVQ